MEYATIGELMFLIIIIIQLHYVDSHYFDTKVLKTLTTRITLLIIYVLYYMHFNMIDVVEIY
jgi:hypothetical protein